MERLVVYLNMNGILKNFRLIYNLNFGSTYLITEDSEALQYQSHCGSVNFWLEIRLCKTQIKIIVLCTFINRCETWTLTSRNKQQLRIFERKILRKIFGPVQDENGIWIIRKNRELNELIGNT